MKEVTGPVIATSLVLAGVFIPISFMSGLTGQFYQQFALTILSDSLGTDIPCYLSGKTPAICKIGCLFLSQSCEEHYRTKYAKHKTVTKCSENFNAEHCNTRGRDNCTMHSGQCRAINTKSCLALFFKQIEKKNTVTRRNVLNLFAIL